MHFVLIAALMAAAEPGYRQSVEQWQTERVNKLKSDDGWLTLIGLSWLAEGGNRVGSAATNRVELPAGFPANAGAFYKRGAEVQWRPASGKPRKLKTDKSGAPDIVNIGRLKLHVIERGSRLGIRLKDPDSPYRRNFQGLTWFPVNEEWNVKARFVPQPKTVVFDAQAGDKQPMASPGYVEWTWRGRKLRLTPVTEGNQLFFVFRDTTAGKSTYSAARYIYTDLPKGGYVSVDFNKAYNPPCVFTPYATCPLPPPENRLPVDVEAGEKKYSGH